MTKLNHPYVLDKDALDYQLAAIFIQRFTDKALHPLGYISLRMNLADRNYDVTHPKCIAIVWAIVLLRLYLQGNHVTLTTDYDSLC